MLIILLEVVYIVHRHQENVSLKEICPGNISRNIFACRSCGFDGLLCLRKLDWKSL